MSFGRVPALIAVLMLTLSCSSPVDMKQAVQITDVATGLFDAGFVDGQNKLVPSLTFRLRDTSGTLSRAALNIVFRMADTGEDQEEIFKQRVDFTDGQTDLITVRTQTGYTGAPPQSRADMLTNSHFRDMVAVIFVREVSAQWVELQRVPIERQLLAK